MKKQNNFSMIFSIVITVLLVAAHVGAVLAFISAKTFYVVYPELFNNIVVIVLCFFAIVDIVYFISVKNKDLIQKIIVCILALFLSVGGIYGAIVLKKTNEVVGNVVDLGDGEEKTETIGGLFVTYDEKYNTITKLEDLKTISDLTIGAMADTSEVSVITVGVEELAMAGVTSYESKTFTNNTDLLFALIGGDIDVAMVPTMYKAVYRADENVDYTQYLEQMNEFGEFNRDITLSSNTSKKDLSKDPFNVLLIGWSPVIGSTTIGLADAIIVATVNPQTYTVSMMSIARDSYVPISCYGGACDKINSGRSTSIDCFVSTVEDLIGEEIDFYMEINFAGFAILVDCLGGVEINNPVSFELDGTYVPEGNYVATGWQALEFARERHHMPNGDFDRQQHQKEVIMQIAKKFLKHDLTFALDVFNEVTPFVNTNLTIKQLSGVFNMLKATKNYTGVSLFNMLDMHALRITGYADWHYNDSYELPLWIYRLYDGSVSESLAHMQEVMGNYKEINQSSLFSFNVEEPYVREPFFSTSYDEAEIHEGLPAYYINLTSMTYADALVWAANNGATLIPTFISPSDSNYNAALDGMIISQSVAYGKKVAKYPTCNVTVMGNGTVLPKLPDDYSGWDIDRAKNWCKDHNYKYSTEAIETDDADKNGLVYDMNIDGDTIIIKYYVLVVDITIPDFTGMTKEQATAKCNELGITCTFINGEQTEDTEKIGKVYAQSKAKDGTMKTGENIELTIYVEKITPTCPEGYHDDGTGTCVIDNPPTPVQCDPGYHDDGTGTCVVDETD